MPPLPRWRRAVDSVSSSQPAEQPDHEQVGLDSAAECRWCQHSEPELAVLSSASGMGPG